MDGGSGDSNEKIMLMIMVVLKLMVVTKLIKVN